MNKKYRSPNGETWIPSNMQLRHAPSTNWDLEFHLHLTNSYWLPLNHYKLKRQCCRQDKSLWINRQLLWEDHVGAHADKLEHIITGTQLSVYHEVYHQCSPVTNVTTEIKLTTNDSDIHHQLNPYNNCMTQGCMDRVQCRHACWASIKPSRSNFPNPLFGHSRSISENHVHLVITFYTRTRV